MIELVFTACLVVAPPQPPASEGCREVRMSFDEAGVTPMACAMVGQVHMSQWVARNPGYVVTKFKCGPVRTEREA